jgi:hypothetical protein
LRLVVIATAAVLGLTAPALAQSGNGPPSAPTRDFAATYRESGSRGRELRMSWLNAEGILRIDTAGGALLQNTRTNRTTILMTEQRMFVEGASDDDRGPGIGLVEPGSRVTRKGTDRVAGHSCTVWRIEEPKEDPEDEPEVKEACVTADGVPLRMVEFEDGKPGDATTATQLDYASQDSARFRVPADYRPFDPKAMNPRQ